MSVSHQVLLLLYVALTVVLLVGLISVLKLHAFLALLISSLLMGALAGLSANKILVTLTTGIGDVLGSVAVVIALGAMLGRMLTASGGADRIAQTLIAQCPPKHVQWAVMAAAFVAGIPLFFEIGFVLLVPLVFVVARRVGVAPLKVGIPLVAALSAVHGLIPPHPGPVLAVQAFGADMGKTMAYGLIVALPTCVVAGPLFGDFISKTVPGHARSDESPHVIGERAALPGIGVTLGTVLLPVILMLLKSLLDMTLSPLSVIRQVSDFAGHPIVALLTAVLLSLYTLGGGQRMDRLRIVSLLDESLRPIAAVILIIGAGGGFKQVLIASGVGDAVAQMALHSGVSPLLLAWLVAGAVRVATGSATVAVITGSGLLAPLTALNPGVSRELLVLATGAGSLMLSHVNDAGFWLVKEYFGLSVADTLKSWSLMETLISVFAMLLIFMLSLLI